MLLSFSLGKCTFGDLISNPYDNGRTCAESVAHYGSTTFCMEANAKMFKDQCCESYPKICADSGTVIGIDNGDISETYLRPLYRFAGRYFFRSLRDSSIVFFK